MYQIRSGKNRQAMNFRLHDTRGIETDQGGNENEMCYLLDGNVPDGYQVKQYIFKSKPWVFSDFEWNVCQLRVNKEK